MIDPTFREAEILMMALDDLMDEADEDPETLNAADHEALESISVKVSAEVERLRP
jgi:hypothetical protein